MKGRRQLFILWEPQELQNRHESPSRSLQGWVLPLRPRRGLQETRVATREESGVLGFPSRRGLTPRGSLECNPDVPGILQARILEWVARASSATTRGFHTQLDEGPETP